MDTRLKESEMLIIAAPIYYHGIPGQMKCVIDRFYSVMYKRKIDCIKRSALFLCSADPDVYAGTIYLYKEEFSNFMELEDFLLQMRAQISKLIRNVHGYLAHKCILKYNVHKEVHI